MYSTTHFHTHTHKHTCTCKYLSFSFLLARIKDVHEADFVMECTLLKDRQGRIKSHISILFEFNMEGGTTTCALQAINHNHIRQEVFFFVCVGGCVCVCACIRLLLRSWVYEYSAKCLFTFLFSLVFFWGGHTFLPFYASHHSILADRKGGILSHKYILGDP